MQYSTHESLKQNISEQVNPLGQFIGFISFREGVNQWNESLLTLAEIPPVPRFKRCWQVHIILRHFARKSVYVGRKYEIQDKMIFILLFTLNFLSVYVICTCLHLGTNGIFANANIDSFHSSSPSQKQDPLPSVWLQRDDCTGIAEIMGWNAVGATWNFQVSKQTVA